MKCLYLSSINGYPIIQTGDSELSIDNHFEDSHKMAVTPIGVISQNNTIDLGKGADKYGLEFVAQSKNQELQIIEACKNIRFIEVVDKYKGKLNVYVNSIKVTNSDTHDGLSYITINITVQEDLIDTISDIGYLLTGYIDLIDTYIDTYIPQLESIKYLYTLKKHTHLNTYDLDFALKHTHFLGDLLKNIHIPVKNVYAEDTQKATSQLEEEEIKKEKVDKILFNLVVLKSNIKNIIEFNFDNKQDFDKYVNLTLDNLEKSYSFIPNEKGYFELRNIIISYAINKKIRRLKLIEVDNEPLQKICKRLYGNLDLYQDLVKVNGINNDNLTKAYVYDFDN